MVAKTPYGAMPGQSARFAIGRKWQTLAVDQLHADSAQSFRVIPAEILPERPFRIQCH
jgi:hypothetical protein